MSVLEPTFTSTGGGRALCDAGMIHDAPVVAIEHELRHHHYEDVLARLSARGLTIDVPGYSLAVALDDAMVRAIDDADLVLLARPEEMELDSIPYVIVRFRSVADSWPTIPTEEQL